MIAARDKFESIESTAVAVDSVPTDTIGFDTDDVRGSVAEIEPLVWAAIAVASDH